MSEIVFLLSAEIDIQKAYEFYEESDERRGEKFLRHLEAAFISLRTFPEIAPIFYGRYDACSSRASPMVFSIRPILRGLLSSA